MKVALINPYDQTVKLDDWPQKELWQKAREFCRGGVDHFSFVLPDGRERAMGLVFEFGLYERPDTLFTVPWYHQPLAGEGVLFGLTPRDGDSADWPLDLDATVEAVKFPSIRVKGFETTQKETSILGRPGVSIETRTIFEDK